MSLSTGNKRKDRETSFSQKLKKSSQDKVPIKRQKTEIIVPNFDLVDGSDEILEAEMEQIVRAGIDLTDKKVGVFTTKTEGKNFGKRSLFVDDEWMCHMDNIRRKPTWLAKKTAETKAKKESSFAGSSPNSAIVVAGDHPPHWYFSKMVGLLEKIEENTRRNTDDQIHLDRSALGRVFECMAEAGIQVDLNPEDA